MVKTIATYILLMVAMSSTAYGSDSEKYPVSLLVREVKAEWVGDVLFRYVVFSPTSDYPCIRLETLTKGFESRLIDRLDVCEIRINNEMIDLRREDLVGAYLGDFRIGKNVFQFTADITLGGPGQISHYMACEVAIGDNGGISKPLCKETQPLERKSE
jgi:hypothetical protein